MLEVNLTLLNEACDSFVIESNPHKIQGLTVLEYADKLVGEVDMSVVEEMIDFDTIYKVKAWVGTKKITCVDFDLESAIETVYSAVKELTC